MSMYTYVHWCIPVYTGVYQCIQVYTFVYLCIPLYAGLYLCILVYTFVFQLKQVDITISKNQVLQILFFYIIIMYINTVHSVKYLK